jgi:DNA polymerase I-like protein with 3'-5' exonuclease and polymerase domains
MTGVEIFNINNEPIDYDEFRRILKDKTHPKHNEVKGIRKGPAKVAQFLSLYGGTAAALALQLRIKPEEAQAIMDAKNAAFPEALQWQERMAEEVVKIGYSIEPCGRRRHGQFDGTWKDSHEARSLVNFVIQSGSSSQIKLILKKLWQENILDRYRIFMYFTVHDSLVFSVHKDDMLNAIKEIHPIMCQRYCDFDLDFKSTIDIGPSFGETVEVGEEIEEEKILELINKY